VPQTPPHPHKESYLAAPDVGERAADVGERLGAAFDGPDATPRPEPRADEGERRSAVPTRLPPGPGSSPPLAVTSGVTGTPSVSGAPRVRVCILCGDPLRAGQRIIRVQGSNVHARCTTNVR
jgi:hypothetical protein